MLPETVSAGLRGRNMVITGGTGLIGRQIVKLLCDAGAHVNCVSLDRIEVDPRARHTLADLCDFQTCKDLTHGMDDVLHVAGIKGSVEVTKSKPASFFVPLLMMNTNMLEAARVNKVQRLVYTSSIGAYEAAEVFVESDEIETGPPMDMFPGWAKRMAEMQIRAYAQQYGLDHFAVVRPCNVYGPGDNFDPENAMVIPTLMAKVRRGDNPVQVWGDGSAIRDFAYSRDVAEGVILALVKGTGGRPVNLASGTGVSIRELVETFQKVVPFEAWFDTDKPGGFPRRVMDISRARRLLGYHPSTSLEQGLRETWAWYLTNADEHERKVNYFREA
ncbi:NAD-dependent epimerase/dehydratase family protein [Azospirillum sp. RWY-5-1]|uniref:NAD-dependent epimerase/dehydratase family protein n=1 Tax=Azospirillum oleiclasticum TaxID=2735135 RepID=A0ABX2TKW5_9PROT|nr:NAD-dependent epimerase/dehydratase family protein [Azospirillum oleiclasticum]NYZ17508.1 NAD-dependent epimerase/dehydratase family protein [Azospirillum oleiclasticum]NYZ24886.1 NAD-dependent epimerase/dehydratase family protein [Azospirillum oleiclasticum]